MNKILWTIWLLITLVASSVFAHKLFGEGSREVFLIGESTYGHYQIEMACDTCHTEPFGGTEILQEACIQCHADELATARDSHPKSKFTDPRNADRINILDARYCITCHTEHKRHQTQAMGVTVPDDYCFHCHQDIEEDRPSHADLAFVSCASAGCHNYHDNRALYEKFLVENAGQNWLQPDDILSDRLRAVSLLETHDPRNRKNSEFPAQIQQFEQAAHDWETSSHAQAGVDCGGCHLDHEKTWIDKPDQQQCRNCHQEETRGFLKGKHGMRLTGEITATLTPITPENAQLPFTAESAHLQQGCNACHGAHQFDPIAAATSACLTCHNDEHSLAFEASPHAMAEGTLKGHQAITCATCHMPKENVSVEGTPVVAVQHNQNDNLRPNEKMIRPVCMRCHSLEFSINALADPALINNNFNGQPAVHVESIDWALKRVQ